MELRTNGERIELVAPDDGVIDPRVLDVPDELVTALNEWAQVVAAMQRADAPEDASAAVLVSRRGMQLADRLSSVLETTVRYHDPLTGEVLFVDAVPTAPAPQRQAKQPEPTPWLTGLTVSALMALVTVSAVLTLAVTLSDTSAFLALGANVVVTAGLAPSIWLARRVLIWRWVALGVASGLALGWIAMIFVLL
ncbi:DUF2537 domain-containing protein [Kibdelosporangium phytohabitans]|uniref:DUF2537 domain-containing protein n=1 Tax=Kibdelosporangium phytohabitans TaxID=860235 RepID=A0A0N7F5K9_9PSEU|nr:DUF2537 domain-containing protein [Kibdelosporangium phytohabitans]ALG14519.1 hypothetical protein AOZ06_03125 [Kibdelosporangium phytohabitans]MBE1465881.1 hypothetical protein [Kibdelosporangium phytohabitans]